MFVEVKDLKKDYGIGENVVHVLKSLNFQLEIQVQVGILLKDLLADSRFRIVFLEKILKLRLLDIISVHRH